MIIEEKFRIQAPIQKLWDFLMDVEAMSSCMPGFEKVEKIDEKTYIGTIKVKVGPISGIFKGEVVITEIDQPRYLASTAQGMDSRTASTLKSRNVLNLTTLSENETEVCVKLDVSILGKLGQFGHSIIREKARRMMEEFAGGVKNRLEVSTDKSTPAI